MRKLIIILLFLPSHFSISQNLEFFREDLRFKLSDAYFYVDGDYYFRNKLDTSLKVRLKYPFPDEHLYGKVDSVFCINGASGSDCTGISINQKYMMFNMDLKPNEEQIVRIGYRQEINSNTALYILTTTQLWNKPFDMVNYTLTVERYKIDSLSYVPDKVEMIDNTTIFYWHKKDFMPDKDFIIKFR